MVAPEIIALEKKNERISAILTTIIVILLLLLTFLWWAKRQRVPPPGEKQEYEVLGSIDFGDYRNGSRNINNFERAVENPTPPTPQESTPQEVPEIVESAPQPIEEIVNPAPSPVTLPEPDPTPRDNPQPTPPKPVENPKPDPTPEPTPEPQESENTQPVEEDLLFDLDSDGTPGSNQGDASSGTGNSGSPDVPVINPDALYTFGTGTDGGVQGRSWLNPSQMTSYNSQDEGSIVYEFTINPAGRVIYVRTIGAITSSELKKIGEDRIKQFRFSPLPPNSPQVNQKVRYKITFKLN